VLRWVAVTLLAAAALAACGGDSSPRAAPSPTATGATSTSPPTFHTSPLPPNAPKCTYPAKVPMPSWYPSDLPLPAGSYPSQALAKKTGYHRSVFVVPGTLADFARFVLTEWPKRGWMLGRGDAESNEVEDSFNKPPAAGAFKAQGQFCSPGFTLALIIYTADVSKVSVGGTVTSPGSPIPTSPSPTG
jgi:hypothetical protein